jgi:hypothetical protein
MDAFRSEHVRFDQLIERHQHRGAGADMIGHGRQRDLDPLARILLALAVERLMVGVFFNEDHGQQARPGKTPCDHMEGRWRLADLLAGPAAELLPHMLGHKPLPRHHIQGLGDILAELRELAAAAARARCRRRVDDTLARQVIRKVPARRLAPREASDLGAGRLGLGRVLPRRRGQFLELQLHLIEKSLAALGARTKSLALHLGDHQLKMLDQRLGARELGARFNERRLQHIHVIGEFVRCRRHEHHSPQSERFVDANPPHESTRRTQPAAAGRQVCSGLRQSIPSSM